MQGLKVWGIFVLFGASVSAFAAPWRAYTFANGNRLVLMEGQKIFFQSKGSDEKFLVTQESVRAFPGSFAHGDKPCKDNEVEFQRLNDSLPTLLRCTPDEESVVAFQTKDAVYVINQLGKTIRIFNEHLPKFPPQFEEYPKGWLKKNDYPETVEGVRRLNVRSFENRDSYYLLLHLHSSTKVKKTVKGPVILVSDDLKAHVIESRAQENLAVDLEMLNKDLLQLSGSPRAKNIDSLNTNEANEIKLEPFDVLLGSADVPPDTFDERPLRDPETFDEDGRVSTSLKVLRDSIEIYTPAILATAFDDLRESDAERIMDALVMKQTGSVVLTGDGGIGKTELVKTFIRNVKRGDYPALPRDLIFIATSGLAIEAGTSHVGVIQARIQAILALVRANPGRVILVIDEIHEMRGRGTHEHQANDIFGSLRGPLANGELHVIGTSNDFNYDQAFGGDEPLQRRLSRQQITPLTEPEILQRLENWIKKYRYAPMSTEDLKWVYRFSEHLDSVGGQPDKARRMVDAVYARLANTAGRADDVPTREDFYLYAAKKFQVPAWEYDLSKADAQIESLKQQLDDQLVGMEELKRFVLRTTRQSLYGVRSKKAPRMSVGLFGPQGLAKTKFAKVYAKAMGLGEAQILDMTRFQTTSGADDLMAEVAGILQKNGFSIILFDEVEKAPVAVQNALLNLLTSDVLKARHSLNGASGKTTSVNVKCSNATFFLTGNAGGDFVRKLYTQQIMGQASQMGFGAASQAVQSKSSQISVDRKDLESAIAQDEVSAPLLNRLDGLFVVTWAQNTAEFAAMLRANLRNILKDKSSELERELKLENQADLIDRLTRRYFQPMSDPRQAIRAMEDAINEGLIELRRKDRDRQAKGEANPGCESFLAITP